MGRVIAPLPNSESVGRLSAVFEALEGSSLTSVALCGSHSLMERFFLGVARNVIRRRLCRYFKLSCIDSVFRFFFSFLRRSLTTRRYSFLNPLDPHGVDALLRAVFGIILDLRFRHRTLSSLLARRESFCE